MGRMPYRKTIDRSAAPSCEVDSLTCARKSAPVRRTLRDVLWKVIQSAQRPSLVRGGPVRTLVRSGQVAVARTAPQRREQERLRP